MDVKERIWLCRMIEKMELQPEFSKKIEIINVSGTDDNTDEKEHRVRK